MIAPRGIREEDDRSGLDRDRDGERAHGPEPALGRAHDGSVRSTTTTAPAMNVTLAMTSFIPRCSRRTAGMIPIAAPREDVPGEVGPADRPQLGVQPQRRDPDGDVLAHHRHRLRVTLSWGTKARIDERGGSIAQMPSSTAVAPPKRKSRSPTNGLPNTAA